MSSLLELACCWVSVVDPNGDSEIGTETRMREGGWQHGGVGIGPRDGVGGVRGQVVLGL